MPLNVFRALTSRGEGNGFFRRQPHGNTQLAIEDAKRRPSIRRQVLTRGFGRNNRDQDIGHLESPASDEVILPVLPPGVDRNARRATVEDYDSFGDDDSYVEVPRHTNEPPVQYNISTGSPRVMPGGLGLRDGPGMHHEPSVHHFQMAPSSEAYSDAGTPRAAQYPMGGYSGRDMIRHPVHMNGTMSRTDSIDSRDLDDDDYSEDGRKHPAFRQITSQPSHSGRSHRGRNAPSQSARDYPYPSSGGDMAISSRTRNAPSSRGYPAHSSRVYDSPSTSADHDHDRVIPMSPPISHTPSSIAPSLPRPMSDTEGSLTPMQHEREIGPDHYDDVRSRGMPDHYDDARSRGLPDHHDDVRSRGLPDHYDDARSRGLPDHHDDVRSRGLPDQYNDARSRGLPDRYDDAPRSRALPDRSEGSHRSHGGSRSKVRREPDTYYIVPPGVSVIFHDEDGNEITRVGDFNNSTKPSHRDPGPLVVQDEFGRELYRYHGSRGGGSSYGGSDGYLENLGSTKSTSGGPNVILIDHDGRQIPVSGSSAASISAGGSHRGGGSQTSSSSGRSKYRTTVNNGVHTIHRE